MAENEDRRVARTKQSIYDALFALMGEKDCERITVTDLAERANINRKTFYVYYAGIDDLLAHIEDELYEKYAPFFRGTEVLSPEFDVYGFFAAVADIIEADMPVLQTLSRSGRLYSLEERLKALIVEELQPQLVMVRDAQALRLYLEYAVAGIFAILIDWIREPKCSLEDFTTFLAKVTLTSFRAIQ